LITVQNDRIRVTVTQEIWDSFTGAAQRLAHIQVLPSGDIRVHSAEQSQRGLVLSEAMSKLGNASELRLMEQEGLDQSEILKLAKICLMEKYLAENGRYDAGETMMRYEGGHRMSQGMASEAAEAEAYAQGQLSPLSDEETRAEMIAAVQDLLNNERDPSQRKIRTTKRLTALRSGTRHRDSTNALAEATDCLAYLRDVELRYRQVHADMDGWQIEIIGEIPDQIGLCRYADEGAA